jgi:hypothetical protein
VLFLARLRARPSGRNINVRARAIRSARPHVTNLIAPHSGDRDAILQKAKLSSIWGDFVAVAINLNKINPGK